MTDALKTNEQLIAELATLRQRIAQLEALACAAQPMDGDLGAANGACLQPEHRLMNLALESISFPLYVIDVQTHRIVLANSARRGHRLPPDATCYGLTHGRSTPCDGSEGACPLEEVSRTKQAVVTRHVHVDRFGTARHFEIHAFPICDGDGSVTHLVEYNVDITERQRNEDELREYQKSLEMLVRELERSNEELREAASIAAHDMRSPLAGIAASATVLKRLSHSKLSDNEKRLLDVLTKTADRTSEMITSLYRCSQLNSGTIRPVDVDLNRIVQELTGIQLRVDVERSRGKIHIPEPLHAVAGDEVQILELMQNLIANSLKYHREGTTPEITLRSRKADNGRIRIEVEDNGIGIRETDYDKVFAMFRRLDDARGREGLGIGLAFCKRVAERHGGRIGVTSRYGVGSTFWVELPKSGRDQAGSRLHASPVGVALRSST